MKYAALATVLIAAAACSPNATDDATTATDTPTTTAEAPAPMTPPGAATSGAEATLAGFVPRMAMSDMFEIESGRIAAQRAQNAEVKSFANMMVKDHTATSTQLKTILAAQPGAPAIPAALDQAHQDRLSRLRDASAEDFDETYLDQQIEAHETALNLLQSYAQSGDNPQVRTFASETAPKVSRHLEMARTLDSSGADEANKNKS